MRRTRRRRCPCCQELFSGDPRTRAQQRYCSKPACRQASKRASQSRWLAKPENQQYFCGPQHVSRVRVWREANPGYGRGRPRRQALQETRLVQGPELPRKSAPLPLQETRRRQGSDGHDPSGAPAEAALQDVM